MREFNFSDIIGAGIAEIEGVERKKVYASSSNREFGLQQLRQNHQHKINVQDKPLCMSDQDYIDCCSFHYGSGSGKKKKGYNPCEDCTEDYQREMRVKGRCINGL